MRERRQEDKNERKSASVLLEAMLKSTRTKGKKRDLVGT